MHATVLKQQHVERPIYNTTGALLTSEKTAASGTTGTLWMSTAAEPPESDRRTGTPHQYQQHELTTRTLATEAETKGASQSQQQKGEPQQRGCQKY
jgi:hypothetical protein